MLIIDFQFSEFNEPIELIATVFPIPSRTINKSHQKLSIYKKSLTCLVLQCYKTSDD